MMFQAVYPPEEIEDWPGRHIEWAEFEWCARVWGDEGDLVSYVGIVLREASYDGQQVLVGGVGGVGTHPAARRRGYARMGLQKAVNFFSEEANVDFALLVCRAELIKYYSHLGWREFEGQLLVSQHGERVEFTFNRVMTLGIGSEAPIAGRIDLCGPPW
jgi:predicted acetyltransferase